MFELRLHYGLQFGYLGESEVLFSDDFEGVGFKVVVDGADEVGLDEIVYLSNWVVFILPQEMVEIFKGAQYFAALAGNIKE